MTPSHPFTTGSERALPLHVVERGGFDAWRQLQLPTLPFGGTAG